MIPVVGLDVAKGATEGQAFLDKGQPYGPHFQILHTTAGFAQFEARLQDVARQAGQSPTMVLESTGHYHVPIVRFLEEHGYVFSPIRFVIGLTNGYGISSPVSGAFLVP